MRVINWATAAFTTSSFFWPFCDPPPLPKTSCKPHHQRPRMRASKQKERNTGEVERKAKKHRFLARNLKSKCRPCTSLGSRSHGRRLAQRIESTGWKTDQQLAIVFKFDHHDSSSPPFSSSSSSGEFFCWPPALRSSFTLLLYGLTSRTFPPRALSA